MSDLLVTTHTPILRSGQTMRTYGIARALAAAGGLTLLYARFEGEHPDSAFTSIPGIELREVVPSRGGRRLLAYGAARLRGVPDGFARGISPDLAAAARRLAAAPGRGRVIADGPIAAADARALRPAPPGRLQRAQPRVRLPPRALRRSGGGASDLRRFERGLLARASETWMVSERDVGRRRRAVPRREASLRAERRRRVRDHAGRPAARPSGARSSSPTSPTSPTATGCASCSTRSSRGCGRSCRMRS